MAALNEEANSVTIGAGGHVPYAAIHQFGGPAGRNLKVTIPARPYLAENDGENMVLAEKDKSWIMETIQDYLREATR